MKTEGKLSSQAKKIIAVIIAILLVGLSYLFVFQKNLDATAESEAKIQKQESEYRRLQSLQRMCDDNEASAEKNAKTMNNYLIRFYQDILKL